MSVRRIRINFEHCYGIHDSLSAWTALSIRGAGSAFDGGWGGKNAASHFPSGTSEERKNLSVPRGTRTNAGLLRRPLARNGGEVRKESPERCRKREGRQGGICNGICKWKKSADSLLMFLLPFLPYIQHQLIPMF